MFDTCGATIADWCKLRPNQLLTADMVSKWELSLVEEATEYEPPSTDVEEGEEWYVESVKWDDFTCTGGRTLELFQARGSDTAQWCPILLCTLQCTRRVDTCSEVPVRLSSIVRSTRSGAVADIDMGTRAQRLDAIYEWFLKNKGRVLRVSAPGYRRARAGAEMFWTDEGEIPYSATKNLAPDACMAGSILNAIAITRGERETAAARARGILDTTWRDLRDANKWVNHHLGSICLERIWTSDRKRRECDLDWLLNESEGIILLELLGSGGLRHVILVDRERDCVVDITEERQIILSSAIILWCCGYHCKFRSFGGLSAHSAAAIISAPTLEKNTRDCLELCQ